MRLSRLRRRGFLAGLGAASLAGGGLVSPYGVRAQTAAAGPLRLLLGSHMDYLQELAGDYAARHGIDPAVDLITTPDLPVRLNSSFVARRDVGDAVFCTAQLAVQLADNEWLTDLTEFVEEKYLAAGGLENALTAATLDGRYYGVPVTVGAPIMHWNKDLCEAAGLDPEAPANWHAQPGSWDDLLEYALAINDPDNNVYGLVDNWGATGSIFTFGSLLQAHGGRFLDDDRNPVMNSEEGVEALTRMVELLHLHRVMDPAAVTYTWVFDASPSYLSGTRGFFFTWPFIAGIANGSDDSQLRGRSGFAPNPSVVTSASVDGSEFLTVPVFSRNPESGLAFIEMALEMDKQIRQGATTAWAPVIADALEHPDVQENLPVAEVIKQSYLYPVDGGYSTDRPRWVEILTGQLSLAFAQRATPREALDDAVSQIIDSRG